MQKITKERNLYKNRCKKNYGVNDQMKNQKDLEMKYIVIKLNDIEKYMSFDRQQIFWSLFWEMIDTKIIHNKADKVYQKLWKKE